MTIQPARSIPPGTPLNLGYRLDEALGVWRPLEEGRPFCYSDGDDVEDRLAKIIASAKDRSTTSVELKAAITDWPSLYHLSARRANLLKPILRQMKGPVLEVGAGCGGITRGLGEEGLDVFAMEGSLRRAHIAASRCVDLPNVFVVNDNLANLASTRSFPTVTLVGVLEYARRFYPAGCEGDAVDAMLSKLRGLVTADGLLVVAIENQLGLKYLAGFPEDHIGEPMVGIEDRYGNGGIVTFGRKELARRLGRAGFPHLQWWFPFPDYKLPVSILSESALNDDVGVDFGHLLAMSYRHDAQAPLRQCFSLQRAWQTVWRNGLAGDLANSFLLLASSRPFEPLESLAVHFGGDRLPAFRKSVHFKRVAGEITVERLGADATIESPKGPVSLVLLSEPYYKGRPWHDELVALLSDPGWTLSNIIDWAKVWWETVVATYRSKQTSAGMLSRTEVFPGNALDAIPRNLMVDGNRRVFFDQEFKAEAPLEAGFVLYRGLRDSFLSVESCGVPRPGTPIAMGDLIIGVAFGVGLWLSDIDLDRYQQFEIYFQGVVTGDKCVHDQTFNSRSLPVRSCYLNDRAECDELRRQLTALEDKTVELVALRKEIEDMKTSPYWRGTAFIRDFINRRRA